MALDPGRYTPAEISVLEADALIVDHEYAEVVDAIRPATMTVYSEDGCTRGRPEFTLIIDGMVATQVGTHVFADGIVLDAREGDADSFIEWLTRAQYDRQVDSSARG